MPAFDKGEGINPLLPNEPSNIASGSKYTPTGERVSNMTHPLLARRNITFFPIYLVSVPDFQARIRISMAFLFEGD